MIAFVAIPRAELLPLLPRCFNRFEDVEAPIAGSITENANGQPVVDTQRVAEQLLSKGETCPISLLGGNMIALECTSKRSARLNVAPSRPPWARQPRPADRRTDDADCADEDDRRTGWDPVHAAHGDRIPARCRPRPKLDEVCWQQLGLIADYLCHELV